jgi:hypothetical protein
LSLSRRLDAILFAFSLAFLFGTDIARWAGSYDA